MTAKEIDALSRRKVELPDDTTLVDAGLYYRLRQLYQAYDDKTITDEQARQDKQAALEAYGYETEKDKQICELQDHIDRDMMILKDDDRRRVAISGLMCEANKNGCDLCKKIAMVYDGRLSPDMVKG